MKSLLYHPPPKPHSNGARQAADEAARQCSVFLSIGTSSVVHPAAGLMAVAARNGAATVEINPERTAATGMVTVALQSGAGEALTQVLEAMRG